MLVRDFKTMAGKDTFSELHGLPKKTHLMIYFSPKCKKQKKNDDVEVTTTLSLFPGLFHGQRLQEILP